MDFTDICLVNVKSLEKMIPIKSLTLEFRCDT